MEADLAGPQENLADNLPQRRPMGPDAEHDSLRQSGRRLERRLFAHHPSDCVAFPPAGIEPADFLGESFSVKLLDDFF